MSAEEYVDSLPMWATKKNSVAGVKCFLEELLSDAGGSEGHRGGPAQVTFGTASAPAGAASGSKAPEGRRLRTGAPDGPSVTSAGAGRVLSVSDGTETSLPLEEWEREFEEARHRAEAGPGKQEIAEIFESDPVQRMKKAAAQVKQWKQDYRTML